MEQEYDLFDLTGLPFDPPPLPRSVQQAILETIEKRKQQRFRETMMLSRFELEKKCAWLQQKNELLFKDKAEENRLIRELADEKRERECGRVRAAAQLLVRSGIRSISDSFIRFDRDKTRLSSDTIKQIYASCGLAVSPVEQPQKARRFPMNMDRIHSELAVLRSMKNPNPNGADFSQIVDLYAFAAFLENDPGNAWRYREMSADELRAIFEEAARKYGQRNDDVGYLCFRISAGAKAYCFASSEQREGYDLYLVCQDEALKALFDALKLIPTGTLLQPDFAEAVIRQIETFIPDPETALAIYNKEARLTDPPYRPIPAGAETPDSGSQA